MSLFDKFEQSYLLIVTNLQQPLKQSKLFCWLSRLTSLYVLDVSHDDNIPTADRNLKQQNFIHG